MVKQAVDISPKNIPAWAEKYLNHLNVLTLLQMVKKTKRQMALEMWLNDKQFEDLAKQFNIKELAETMYFNKKGAAVFFWNSASEKTAFFLKWG